MYTIVIANQKGGVGKTTTAASLAHGLRLAGKRVLVVDLDPRGNLSLIGRAAQVPHEKDLLDLFMMGEDFEKALCPTVMGDLLPSSTGLDLIDSSGSSQEASLRSDLKKILETVETYRSGYDYCVIDTPASMMLLTPVALALADGVIAPATVDLFSIQATDNLLNSIIDICKRYDSRLRWLRILPTSYRPRTKLVGEMLPVFQVLADNMGARLFSPIRFSNKINEAQSCQATIFPLCQNTSQ